MAAGAAVAEVLGLWCSILDTYCLLQQCPLLWALEGRSLDPAAWETAAPQAALEAGSWLRVEAVGDMVEAKLMPLRWMACLEAQVEEGAGRKWHHRALYLLQDRRYQPTLLLDPLVWDQVRMFLAAQGDMEGVGQILSMLVAVVVGGLGLLVQQHRRRILAQEETESTRLHHPLLFTRLPVCLAQHTPV